MAVELQRLQAADPITNVGGPGHDCVILDIHPGDTTSLNFDYRTTPAQPKQGEQFNYSLFAGLGSWKKLIQRSSTIKSLWVGLTVSKSCLIWTASVFCSDNSQLNNPA